MTIKTYLQHLEQTEKDLLSLNLPEDTRLVNPPDMGSMIDYGVSDVSFFPIEAFVYNDCCYKYEFLFDKKLTEKETIVIVGESYSR